jgi:hypothetical protein
MTKQIAFLEITLHGFYASQIDNDGMNLMSAIDMVDDNCL